MERVLLFAGTSEGRLLFDYCRENKIAVTACVATEYGRALLTEGPECKIREGRLNREQMEELIKEENISFIIDATHPYACDVTDNINEAGKALEIPVLRVIRKSLPIKEAIEVRDIKEAVRFLNEHEGNALIVTGSKEVAKYREVTGYKERLYVRILPDNAALSQCLALGFPAKHVICMQGPFSRELNYAMLKQINGRYLVTKEGGSYGGYEEKIEGSKMAGAEVIVIGRPRQEVGNTPEEIMAILREWKGRSEPDFVRVGKYADGSQP